MAVVVPGVLGACQAPDRRGTATTPPSATASGPPTSSLPAPVDRIRWNVNLDDDQTEATPAFAAGVIFVSTHHGKLAALDAKSGAVRWRGQLGGSGDAVAVGDGRMYVASGDVTASRCRLHALDAATGAPRWTRTSRPCAGLTLGADVAYLATNGVSHNSGRILERARVVALGADTGRQRWSVQIDGPTAELSAPMVAGRTVYVTSSAGLIALDAASGRVRWRAEVGSGSASSPVSHGGLVHVVRAWGDGESAVYAFDTNSGRQAWMFQVNGLGFQAPVVATDTVVVVSQDGRVRGLNSRTGRLRWVRAFAKTDAARPPARAVSAGSTVYVSLAGSLHALDARTGHTQWTDPNPPPGDPLGADNGVVYLGAANGVISAVGAP